MQKEALSILTLKEADEVIAAMSARHHVPIEDLKISLWCLWFPPAVRDSDLSSSWIGRSSLEVRSRYEELLRHDAGRLVENATQQAQVELLLRGLHYKDGVLYRMPCSAQ